MGENKPIKTNILHISHTDIRTDSRILKELKSLDDTGKYNVSALGVDYDNLEREAKLPKSILIESIPLYFTKRKWRPSILRHILALIELVFKAAIRSKKHAPDVIHCHDTLALMIGGLVSLFTKTKLVYDAHELESQKNAQSALASKVVFLVEKVLWRKVDVLISVSPSILEWYDTHLGAKPHALVLNAPTLEQATVIGDAVDAPSSYFKDKYDIPEESVVFIYLGLLVEGRGIDLLLDAFSKLDERAHVVFMGYGELDSSIVARSKKSPNIHYHPAVPHTEVIKLTKSADVGLCFIERASLSDYYCLPNKLFEYAFSGIPVLASNFPDLREYVEKYRLGACSDIDAEAISEQVKNLVDGDLPIVGSDLSDLSWQAQSDRLVSAYEELVG